MRRLEIHTFGGFEVRRGDRRLTDLESRKVEALGAYLVAHRHQSVSRDLLAAMVWPDRPDASARRNLRQALYNLRSTIEGDATPCFVVDGRSVQFDPHPDDWIDLDPFESMLLAEDGSNAADPRELAGAVRLYRGDFLAGIVPPSLDYEEWLLAEQERYREAVLRALRELVDHALATGDYETGIRYARRLVADRPALGGGPPQADPPLRPVRPPRPRPGPLRGAGGAAGPGARRRAARGDRRALPLACATARPRPRDAAGGAGADRPGAAAGRPGGVPRRARGPLARGPRRARPPHPRGRRRGRRQDPPGQDLPPRAGRRRPAPPCSRGPGSSSSRRCPSVGIHDALDDLLAHELDAVERLLEGASAAELADLARLSRASPGPRARRASGWPRPDVRRLGRAGATQTGGTARATTPCAADRPRRRPGARADRRPADSDGGGAGDPLPRGPRTGPTARASSCSPLSPAARRACRSGCWRRPGWSSDALPRLAEDTADRHRVLEPLAGSDLHALVGEPGGPGGGGDADRAAGASDRRQRPARRAPWSTCSGTWGSSSRSRTAAGT